MAVTQADIIQSHVQGALAMLHTSMPAIITDISELETRNVVSVVPAVRKTDSTGFSYDMAVIEDVPVQWPAGGGAVLTFPLAVGDDVILTCCMTSVVEWFLSSSGTATPFDNRMHDISDSFVIPCVFREANNPLPSKDNVVLKYGGKSVKLEKDDGDLIISSDTKVIVNGDTTLNGNLSVDGTISATGDITTEASVVADVEVTAGTVNLTLHTHPYVDTPIGAATTSPPTP